MEETSQVVSLIPQSIRNIPDPISTVKEIPKRVLEDVGRVYLRYLWREALRNVEINEIKLSRLPQELREIGTALSEIFYIFSWSYLRKKPAKVVLDVDEELDEPVVILFFGEELSSREEVAILKQLLKLRWELSNKDERVLDVSILVRRLKKR
ncbi:hypothetical protein [Thermococcus sp. 2319x1]|uniref:hypothetical protein n=1 Tax=Thermococcus sp. 2319x1 TaxID=1674923 RepID=UPI0015834569|nr:hypothetical protein [Thermococcus sp. 2319x1]